MVRHQVFQLKQPKELCLEEDAGGVGPRVEDQLAGPEVVEHRAKVGGVTVDEISSIPHHTWKEFPRGCTKTVD